MKIELFDTTLRDGTQGENVNLSIQDKLAITRKLDEFGVDYIEGGWPGSNPRDEEYFKKVKMLELEHSKICAFGSTARYTDKVNEDINLNKLLFAETPVIAIFGKTWQFHSKESLGLTDHENEELIFKSIEFVKKEGRHVIFDAEHFFDGFKDNQVFAMRMINAAIAGGADNITLCDTNGGSLPSEINKIISYVKKETQAPLGIHTHNDGELAVANTLAAVDNGATLVQGTINGVGERCGNANLCSIIPNLRLKLNSELDEKVKLESLTSVSHFVSEIMNHNPNHRAAFVGKSAFAHKGGIHVSAVLKNSKMYEHIRPEVVGNTQRVLVSDLAGQSNIRYKAKKLNINLEDRPSFSKQLVQYIKSLEFEGYQFDGAEASFELLLRKRLDEYNPFFRIDYATTNVTFDDKSFDHSEAVLKIEVNGEIEHTASEGNGPVSALDNALRKALVRFYPELQSVHLVDYKVRVLGEKDGTSAKVRVLTESSDGIVNWSTVGVSENIIHASLQALSDSFNYKLFKSVNIEKSQKSICNF